MHNILLFKKQGTLYFEFNDNAKSTLTSELLYKDEDVAIFLSPQFLDSMMEFSLELELEEDKKVSLFKGLSSLWHFMPASVEKDYYLCPREIKIDRNFNEEVTFFGGTFNPWHEGHSECLRQCPSKNIIVIPDSNPWKAESGRVVNVDTFIEISQRARGIREDISIYPKFFFENTPNPTVNWLPKVSSKVKNLLIGDDNFKKFLEWDRVEELIISLNKIYVVPRLFELEELSEVKEKIEAISKDIEVIFLENHPYQNISSTEIRNS